MCRDNIKQNQGVVDSAMAARGVESEVGEGAEDSSLRLDPAAQALIGRQLKAFYGKIVDEEIPQNLLDLLDELERREKSGEGRK